MATTLRFTDDFSGAGDLNGSPVGATTASWQAIAGTWQRQNGLAVTSAAASTNPILATNLTIGDADLTLNGYTGFGGGDSLYFRVSDTNNWWRLRQRVTQTSSTVQTGWQGTGWVETGQYVTSGDLGTTYQDYVHNIPQLKIVYWSSGNTTYETDYKQSVVPTYSTEYHSYHYLVLEKMVAGTLTQVDAWLVSGFNQLRIVAAGNSIQYFEPDGLTVHASVVDAFNAGASLHGLGLGGTDNYTVASGLTTWVAQLHGSAAVPSILSPLSGADVEFVSGVAVTVRANYPPGDPATAVDIRWRTAAAADWTEVDAALTGSGSWPIPLGSVAAGDSMEVQARSTDSFATVSAWSSSTFFTFRNRPTPPTFLSPASGGLVTALQVAVVDFDTDGVNATSMQARRVGDAGTAPDEATIYQAFLTITVMDDGSYKLIGDGVTHTTGTEYVEARRQTAEGGSLWSDWASLLVTEEVAQPYPPIVTWVPLADDAAIDFTLTPQAADPLHKATVRLEVERDGERVLATGAAGPVTWRDTRAGTASDYTFTAIADDETKAQVS